MSIHKTGIVLSPKPYHDWQAECIGDLTDTGGVYVVLRHSAHFQPVTFWEVALDEMEQVLRDKKIIILWEGEGTISSFLGESNLTKKFAKKIINNFYDQTELKMVFNITQLNFDFDESLVKLSYYVEQKGYPEVIFSIEQLECLLLDYLSQ